MSDGDDEPGEAAGEGELEAASFEDALAAVTDPIEADEVGADALNEALDAVDGALDAAETEADLDAVDAAIDDVEAALESTDLPAPDEEDAEDPREEIEGRLDDARSAVEAERGPYASDAVEAIEAVAADVENTRWTEQGEAELVEPVQAFVEDAGAALAADLATEAETPAGLADALGRAADAIADADLDPDDDAGTIAALLDAVDALESGVEAAESWDDLTTREKLDAEGFYDVLDHRKDYPPEWAALKAWERAGNAEMVLLALEHLGSDYMEEHCLEALRRLGDPAALEPMLERAGRRDQDAIEILGKIGDGSAVDTIVEYVGTDSDPGLERTTLRALGEIGSEDATQAVADRLAAENPLVRSSAARALGLIGDPRAVEPLAAALGEDDDWTVRGSAAWALVQIGTEAALEAAAAYADDRVPLVQSEAEAAAEALGAKPA
ncbi:MAG: HEAT repeat domain-containing protein [Halobacteriales archaeon]